MEQVMDAKFLVEKHVCADISILVYDLAGNDTDILDKYYGRFGTIYDEETEEYTEIFEFYIVTQFLAEELVKRKEIVWDMFNGQYIWGRTCCGQAVYMDGVMQEIAEELYRDY